MRHRAGGQSITEMAFVLPVLLLVLFGIIEFGYMIFAYSSVSQAARNAAETAAQLPPYATWLAYKNNVPAGIPSFRADACVNSIMVAAETDATIFGSGGNQGRRMQDHLTIRYPNDTATHSTRNLADRGPIEITISYPVTGLTPLFPLLRFGGETGTINLTVTQRRSIENLGMDPNKPTGVACARDADDWHDLNP